MRDVIHHRIQVVDSTALEQSPVVYREPKPAARLAVKANVNRALCDDNERPECLMRKIREVVYDEVPYGAAKLQIDRRVAVGEDRDWVSVKVGMA
jgi:hypothetical protein